MGEAALVTGAASGIGRAVAERLVASPFKAGYVSAKHGVLGLVTGAPCDGRRLDGALTHPGRDG